MRHKLIVNWKTHLRNILGTRTLSEILAEREVISEEILKILDKVKQIVLLTDFVDRYVDIDVDE